MRIEAAADGILKTDNRGRVRVTPERRAALLEEFDRSGATAAAFSRMCGVNYQTFAGWALKRRKQGGMVALPLEGGVATSVRFAEVMAPARATTDGIDIVFPSGARMKVGDEAQCELAAVLLAFLSQRGGRAC